MDESLKKTLVKRQGALETERSSFLTQWQDISRYLLPRSGRFMVSDRNKGDQSKYNQIYDNTATRALRVLGAGLMSGATSPARPWFRLATFDPDMMDYAPVKMWLSDVQRQMLDVFQRSNTYRALHTMYEDCGAFGNGVSLLLDDYKDMIRHYVLPIGEYSLALNARGEVDTVYRKFDKTVSQLVEEYGLERCSRTVKNLYENNRRDAWVTIVHAIEPRKVRQLDRKDAANMPWRSVHFELGGDEDTLLRESGFKEFPGLAPRWSVIGGDVYGAGPGLEALGDIKQLQHEQLRKAQGIDFMTQPPLQAPTALKNHEIDGLPGGITFADSANPNGGIRTLFEVGLNLEHLLADILDVRNRISETFYTNLFLMLTNAPKNNMTATEVAERHEEKLLMLGPTLERLHNELLSPMINRTFLRMVETGTLPPPPPELLGQELNVQYVSMLAQAQRAVATQGIDRFVGNLGAVAGIKPEVLDKFDADQWADVYADQLGVNPELIVADDKVAIIRKARAEAIQQQQRQQQAALAASTAKDMSAAAGGQDVTKMFSGYTQ